MRLWLICAFLFQAALFAQEPWTIFHADSHLQFALPSALAQEAGSGEGEMKWVHRFHSPDEAFQLESTGFHAMEREAIHASMNTRQLILKHLLQGRRREVTYTKFTKHYLLVITVDRKVNVKRLDKYWLGHKSASGYAVKSLSITFPADRRKEFDPWLQRIEASWDPAESWGTCIGAPA